MLGNYMKKIHYVDQEFIWIFGISFGANINTMTLDRSKMSYT